MQVGNSQVAGLLAQILAATKKQSDADAAAAAAAAKAEAERQAEIARQQALAAEMAKNLAMVSALQTELNKAGLSGYKGSKLDAELNFKITALQELFNATGGTVFLDAISQWKDLQTRIAAARQAQTAAGQTPAFADGGMHSGGLRLVGENGPELEATGPARIYNARQTAGILAGGADMVAELRLLRQEVGELRYEARATATNTNKTQRLLERVTLDGEAMQTVAYS